MEKKVENEMETGVIEGYKELSGLGQALLPSRKR